MPAQDRQTLPIPSLRNIQSFIAVANSLSIHLAAEQLNVTASAVSHQIASLESWMGKKLFIRSGKGVTLTPTGEKYLRDVSAAMSAIGRATEQVMKEADNPVLRVHSSPTFGLTWLLRRLGKFRSEYPDITVNLSCSYENLQFARDNIDIDIRHGIPDWDAYRVMTIKTMRWWCWPHRHICVHIPSTRRRTCFHRRLSRRPAPSSTGKNGLPGTISTAPGSTSA